MRILFCFVGGPGHFEPMRPIARAASAARHTVAVACGWSRVPAVEAAGFTAFGIGPAASARPPRWLPLTEVDVAREEQDLRERFAGSGARIRADWVLELASDWRPDVIVADETDFGSVLAAERLDLPYAIALVLAAGSLVRADVVADTLDGVRIEHGLPPRPRSSCAEPIPRVVTLPAQPARAGPPAAPYRPSVPLSRLPICR